MSLGFGLFERSDVRRLVLVAVVVFALVLPGTAVAGPKGKGGGRGGGGDGGGGGGGGTGGTPTALVTMGDSYISGEGGRWSGNWASSSGNRGGTDRAAFKRRGTWYYDASRVYGATTTGCHRSDVAPAVSTSVAVDARINLACSGAVTQNILRAVNGGGGQHGEAPQADQLANVAATHDVEVIVLSIGGNDLGFADIILDCALSWYTSPSWWKNTCNGEQQANVDSRMPAAMAGVDAAIGEIQAVMAAAGDTDYRLILQSYPSPIPNGSEIRYSESGWSRWDTGGCPFWNVDATWARSSLVPQISNNLQAVANARGVEFLDLRDALDGREVCATSASQGNSADAEWARFLVTGITQGDAQESMHPNALGQRANGTCIDLVLAAGPGNYSYTNVAGSGPETMVLTPT